MRFPESDVRQLLCHHFDEVEALSEASPYDETLVCALTVKEFMRDREIGDVTEALAAYASFKAEQGRELSRLGIGHLEPSQRIPSSLRLTPTAA